jgi:hypothetical protein
VRSTQRCHCQRQLPAGAPPPRFREPRGGSPPTSVSVPSSSFGRHNSCFASVPFREYRSGRNRRRILLQFWSERFRVIQAAGGSGCFALLAIFGFRNARRRAYSYSTSLGSDGSGLRTVVAHHHCLPLFPTTTSFPHVARLQRHDGPPCTACRASQTAIP